MAETTVAALAAASFEEVDLSQSIIRTRGRTTVMDTPKTWLRMFPTPIEMFLGTTLECCAAIKSLRSDARVAVLNFASAKNAGGGFMRGAQAQEESIARTSTLYSSLTTRLASEGFYARHRTDLGAAGLYSDRVIFSPDILVFRDEHSGAVLKTPYVIDVYSSAAVNVCALEDFARRRRTQVDDSMVSTAMQRRISCVVAHIAAREPKYDAVVLGAFGCGVFKNDPEMVAKAFKLALAKVPIVRAIFAIPDDNYEKFEEVLMK
jgi:uncharacterized protein (TIGR02452 family)